MAVSSETELWVSPTACRGAAAWPSPTEMCLLGGGKPWWRRPAVAGGLPRSVPDQLRPSFAGGTAAGAETGAAAGAETGTAAAAETGGAGATGEGGGREGAPPQT